MSSLAATVRCFHACVHPTRHRYEPRVDVLSFALQPPAGHTLVKWGILEAFGIFAISVSGHTSLPVLRNSMKNPKVRTLAGSLQGLCSTRMRTSLQVAAYLLLFEKNTWYFTYKLLTPCHAALSLCIAGAERCRQPKSKKVSSLHHILLSSGLACLALLSHF